MQKTFTGGQLITLRHGVLASACRQDIRKNEVWIEPIVRWSTDKVPSSYMIADVFMRLDQRLNGALLKDPSGKVEKSVMALQEGSKASKIIGYLRYLFRASEKAPTRSWRSSRTTW